MQHLSKAELSAARDGLRRADRALRTTRGVFITAGHGQAAASVNALIDKLAHLLARIDRALTAKP